MHFISFPWLILYMALISLMIDWCQILVWADRSGKIHCCAAHVNQGTTGILWASIWAWMPEVACIWMRIHNCKLAVIQLGRFCETHWLAGIRLAPRTSKLCKSGSASCEYICLIVQLSFPCDSYWCGVHETVIPLTYLTSGSFIWELIVRLMLNWGASNVSVQIYISLGAKGDWLGPTDHSNTFIWLMGKYTMRWWWLVWCAGHHGPLSLDHDNLALWM